MIPKIEMKVIDAENLQIGDKILVFTDAENYFRATHSDKTCRNESLDKEPFVAIITNITEKNEMENVVHYSFFDGNEIYRSNFYASLNAKFGVTWVVKLTIEYAHFLDAHEINS